MSRLQELYEEMVKLNLIANKKDFAEKFGFAYANLARYLNGQLKTTIDSENYRKFADSGINIDWLLTGEGEMFSTSSAGAVPAVPGKADSRIPVLSQKVSCGPGRSWEDEQNIVEYIDIASLSPKLTSKNVYGFRASGTSMIGAGIRDGDIVLFSSDRDQCIEDGIYVFGLDGDAYCKRLEFDRIANRIKIYSVRVADLEKAELLKTLDSSDEGFAERFQLFGKVFSWIHLIRGE